MCCFLPAQILTLLNWIEIPTRSLGSLIFCMETAVDVKIRRFGTGCSQGNSIQLVLLGSCLVLSLSVDTFSLVVSFEQKSDVSDVREFS